MPRLIKKVAGMQASSNGKVKCGVMEKDLTQILKAEFERMKSNNVDLGLGV